MWRIPRDERKAVGWLAGNRWPRATGHIGEQRLESSEEEGRRRRWKRSRRGPSEMARARWILRRVSHGSSLSLRYLSLAYLLFLPFPTSCFPRTCFLAPASVLSTDELSLQTRYLAMLSTPTHVLNICEEKLLSKICILLQISFYFWIKKILFFDPAYVASIITLLSLLFSK